MVSRQRPRAHANGAPAHAHPPAMPATPAMPAMYPVPACGGLGRGHQEPRVEEYAYLQPADTFLERVCVSQGTSCSSDPDLDYPEEERSCEWMTGSTEPGSRSGRDTSSSDSDPMYPHSRRRGRHRRQQQHRGWDEEDLDIDMEWGMERDMVSLSHDHMSQGSVSVGSAGREPEEDYDDHDLDSPSSTSRGCTSEDSDDLGMASQSSASASLGSGDQDWACQERDSQDDGSGGQPGAPAVASPAVTGRGSMPGVSQGRPGVSQGMSSASQGTAPPAAVAAAASPAAADPPSTSQPKRGSPVTMCHQPPAAAAFPAAAGPQASDACPHGTGPAPHAASAAATGPVLQSYISFDPLNQPLAQARLSRLAHPALFRLANDLQQCRGVVATSSLPQDHPLFPLITATWQRSNPDLPAASADLVGDFVAQLATAWRPLGYPFQVHASQQQQSAQEVLYNGVISAHLVLTQLMELAGAPQGQELLLLPVYHNRGKWVTLGQLLQANDDPARGLQLVKVSMSDHASCSVSEWLTRTGLEVLLLLAADGFLSIRCDKPPPPPE